MQKFKFSDIFLTKEFILENVSEETIFSTYLYPVNFNKRFINPFREDEHPDCTFYISRTGNLWFVDKAWNNKHYSAFDACSAYYGGISFQDALKMIYKDLIEGSGATDSKIIDVSLERQKKMRYNGVDITANRKDFLSSEINFWCVGGIDSDQKDLETFGIYSAKSFSVNDTYFSNVKDTYIYVGENNQIDQLYSPNKQEFRFINRKNFNFHFNSQNHDSDTHFLCKSKKCSYFISRYGYSTSYAANENITIDREIFERYGLGEYKYLFVMGDNDDTGREFMSAHYNEFEMTPAPVPLKKDMTEYLDEVGYREAGDFLENLKFKI